MDTIKIADLSVDVEILPSALKKNARLTDEEYETLSLEYEQNPPELSSQPGFLTGTRERMLVTELLPPVKKTNGALM